MLLIAHRGNTIDYPENTMEAFQSAFDLGADGIELDVQTQHNIPIVVHNYIGPKGPYPTLEEVIKTFANKGHLEIEIKSFTFHDVDIITETINKLRPPDIEVTSSVHPILSYVKSKLPTTDIGAIFKNTFIEPWMSEEFIIEHLDGFMKLTTSDVIHFPPSIYSTKIISTLKKSYITHHHLQTGDTKEYERLKNLNIDRATFDDIKLLQHVGVH